MKKILIAVTFLTVSTCLPVYSDNADLEIYVGGSHIFWDGDRDLDDATGVDIGLALPINNRWAVEAWYSNFETEFEDFPIDVDGDRFAINGLYHLQDDSSLLPFVTVGLDQLVLEPDGFNFEEKQTTATAGFGIKKYFDSNVILRGEAMYMHGLDDSFNDFGIRFSIGYAFGRSKTPVLKSTPPTPPPTPVEEPPVVAAPVDSDGDGVFDDTDQCPNTEANIKVDEKGCALLLTETVTVELKVKFANNSDVVESEYFSEIEQVAKFMRDYSKTQVTVEGHTDDRGSAEYNQALSQRRANSVRQVLIDRFGILAERITAIGYGEQRPIADNATEAGRIENRRVVAVIESDVVKPVTE